MIPMPTHVMEIQTAYASLIDEVCTAIDGTNLNPSAALLLAFIGDQEMTATKLLKRGYYIQRNVSYNLKLLEGSGYIKKQMKRLDGREKHISLTAEGLALAQQIRLALAERREKVGIAA